METALSEEEGSRYYGDEKSIRLPTSVPPPRPVTPLEIPFMLMCKKRKTANIIHDCTSAVTLGADKTINLPDIRIDALLCVCVGGREGGLFVSPSVSPQLPDIYSPAQVINQ